MSIKNREELIVLLENIRNDLDERGLEYFLVASVPGSDIGASIYNGRSKNGAAKNARQAHIAWEHERGLDPDHDNRDK
jgi:hypothetical protein